MPLFRLAVLALGLSATALAQDVPPVAPEPSTAPEAPSAGVEEAPSAGVEEAPSATVEQAPAATVEVREAYDERGRRVRRLVMDGVVVVSETATTWDDADRPIERVETAGGERTEERWTYTPEGHVATYTKTVDGVEARTESWTWAEGRAVRRDAVEGGRALVTTWTYDATGAETSMETRDAAGTLVERVLAVRPTPPPALYTPAPFLFGVEGGVATNTDVRVNDFTVGFSVARKPKPEDYERDPLELLFAGKHQLGLAKDQKTNEHSALQFRVDYNHLLPRTSVFLFGDVERNPVSNLDIDVELAPLGIKYDFVNTSKGAFDASFAPLWNYRSVLVPGGGDCEGAPVELDTHCTLSRARGSFRVRATFTPEGVVIADTIEFVPSLNPASGDLIDGIRTEAILRNRFEATVKISKVLSLRESVTLTRDPLLAQQVDCAADPHSLLCDGVSLQTATTLVLSLAKTQKPR